MLQRWIDHDTGDAGLVVALAGSSQRMMQGAWTPGGRWWMGHAPERDIVAEDEAGKRVRRVAAIADGLRLALDLS